MSAAAEPPKVEDRPRRRAEAEAKELVAEARRILKDKADKLPETVSNDIEQAALVVEGALHSPKLEDVQVAMGTLEQKMDQHLAFARKSTFREYGESIGVAVLIALVLRAFVVEPFQIPSGSMIPTLEIGDHIFVAKFSYGLGIPFTNQKVFQFASPKRGDVIVFKYPVDTEIDYIKRVVGLPGETVELRKGEVFVDGRPMSRELSNEPCDANEGGGDCGLWTENLDGKRHQVAYNTYGGRSDWPPRPDDSPHQGMGPGGKVLPGYVFVMGDNRDNSNDSRVWGAVKMELIKGKAMIVWWSRNPADAAQEGGIKGWFSSVKWRRFLKVLQ